MMTLNQHRHLSEEERETLQRVVNEYGLAFVAEHSGVSTRVIHQALSSHSHHLSLDHFDRLLSYLHAKV